MRPSTQVIHLAYIIAALCSGCDGEGQEPLERVGEPLAISPQRDQNDEFDGGLEPTRDGDVAPVGDGSLASSAAVDEAPRQMAPQPAKALSLAVEADMAGARGELGQALTTYTRAVNFNQRSPWMRVARAWYESRTGDLTGARDDLEQALDLTERQDPFLLAALHHGLGELRESRRDWARARESYRTALRAWSAPPLARSLLRVTPPTNDQRSAAEKLAFSGQTFPARVIETFAKRGGSAPLAATEIANQGLAVVTALPQPRSSAIPAGAQYRVHIEDPTLIPDAGVAKAPAKLPIGEVSAVRWHQAKAETLTLNKGIAVLVTVESIGPGVGAPQESWTSLVTVQADGALQLVVKRQTGSERDDPIGCRRGWREKVTVSDNALLVVREDFVRPRLKQASSFCTKRTKTKAPETVALKVQ